VLRRVIVENGSVHKYTIYEDFLLSIDVKCFDRNKYSLIQIYFCVCDYSGHINMYSAHKRHKGTPEFHQTDGVFCFLKEKKPCFWLFLLWLSDP